MKYLLMLPLFTLLGCATPVKTPVARVPSATGSFAGIGAGLAAGLYKGPIVLPAEDARRAAANLYLPLQYDRQEAWPLVVLLHGYTATGEQEDSYLTTRFRVSTRGFMLVTPNGIPTPAGTKGAAGEDLGGKPFWNATDACCDFGATGVDDVGYLSALIENIATKYKVDRKRIYLFGHSNGGFMANRLACELGDKISGVASLAGGTFKDPGLCKNQSPISYLQIHGVDDGTIVYGNDPKYAGGKETVEQWVKRNGCTGAPKVDGKKDYVYLVPSIDTTQESWSNCTGGTRVAFWTIREYSGGKHYAHIPIFNTSFTGDVLEFLMAPRK